MFPWKVVPHLVILSLGVAVFFGIVLGSGTRVRMAALACILGTLPTWFSPLLTWPGGDDGFHARQGTLPS